ncbi:hypothetical protein A9Q94_08425 [Rhodobacterales bacterium 56_14_T64]|nr:hypothetical protein A9Q94_08425 [Rhodobacterales bacterium 56_14_T64]
MDNRARILVTSAAGKTGQPVTLQLLAKGYPVRAFVRCIDERSARLKQAGAEIFVGNQYSLNDMRRAMAGMTRGYQCAPTAPNGLHFNMVYAAAAYETGLKHTVTLGQWLSSADHASLFTREVHLNDILIAMRPEMTVTNVNVGWFAENYLMVLDTAAHLGLLTMPLGPGHIKNNAPPSNEDIARVVVGALTDPAAHAGKTYRPTGPELLSPDQIAAIIGKVLKRKVKYSNLTVKMFLKALKAVPPTNYSDAAVTQLKLYTEEYRRGTFAVGGPTDAVKKVSGQDAESFEEIVRRAVAGRKDLSPSLWRRGFALSQFFNILATRAPDPESIELQKDYVQLEKPVFSQDDLEWCDTHTPAGTGSKTLQAV